MAPSKKTILYIIYTLIAINTFLLGVLLIIGFQTVRARTEPPAASRAAEKGEQPAPVISQLTPLPTNAEPDGTEAGAVSTQVEPGGMETEPDDPEAEPVSIIPEPDDAGGNGLIFLPLVQHVIPQPFIARNVIVFIGDGMGLEHVKAGSMYASGAPGGLPFERFPYHALMSTGSNSGVTDSAAAATAMATGYKVDNRVISMDAPGDGRHYKTLLEYASAHDMSTGLVTTTPITDATPASFGAHTESRVNSANIARDYIKYSRPNVLFGGGSSDLSEDRASAAGYRVVSDRNELLALDTELETMVSGQFGEGYLPYETDGLGDQPHLSEMTAVALRILDNDPDGFFVMIEGGRIDTASHNNNAEAMVGEMVEFGRAVQAALDWAAGRDDTLIIVLADHETGGLEVTQSNGQGVIPEMRWGTTGHTDVQVGMWATSEKPLYGLTESIDNTQIPALITAGEFYLP